jgi:Fis family transcriptional regulator, factor for inversion stimulation protein
MKEPLTVNSLLNELTKPNTALPVSGMLRNHIRESLRQYFIHLENTPPNNLYDLVVGEMEAPLLEIVLQFVGHNQSEAARLLNMSRGTLRKKMQTYGLPFKRKRD